MSDITENSATLICELPCFFSNLRCVVSQFTTNNMDVNVASGSGQVTDSLMAYSYPTQTILLIGLNNGTTYNCCVVATDAINMIQVGEPVCGNFTTAINTIDNSDGR